jgi:RimJ/RimL family protein N-acetyltransferase
MGYFLTTARLGFRSWREEDLPLARELWGDGEVAALIGGPFDEQAIRAKLDKEIANGEYDMQYWPIFLLENDRHVGCAGLRPYREKTYELGFHLRKEFWGKGLASEAGRAVIDYGFGKLGAEALFAGHHPANGGSRHVLLKLGFVYTHDEIYAATRKMHPSYLLRRGQSGRDSGVELN